MQPEISIRIKARQDTKFRAIKIIMVSSGVAAMNEIQGYDGYELKNL
jgi:hypothetical protein